METVDDTSLREYLRLQAKRVKDPPCIPEYDEFLVKVWDFFALRVSAEDYFKDNQHVAISKRGPLPVSWQSVRNVWRKSSNDPPEQPITLIAKRNYNDVNSLVGNLRKVLARVRQKVTLGRVQQVDAHCLRWLTRQPGRSAAEKGGARQEILGVVRVENYNTLENRVLKDFLSRCLALAVMYLRRYDDAPKDHVNIKAVVRFKNLCVAGLALQEMDKVSDIREFPQPNFVLQQDRLYSKVWQSYCDIMRQEDVAERLWKRRQEIDELYAKCDAKIDLHCSPRALYDVPLWICELDGRGSIFENPIWDNEEGPCDVVLPNPAEAEIKICDNTIVDLTYPWDDRNELAYPSLHRNARPFLQNKHRPSLEPCTTVLIQDILRTRNAEQLADYFRQLYGLLGGSRWVVLVPDNWDSMWLETVLRANVLSRDRVFLLWRSVAAVLGYMETENFHKETEIVVSDGFADSSYNATCIRFMRDVDAGCILPQRASPRLHSDENGHGEVRFKFDRPFGDKQSPYGVGIDTANRLCVGLLSKSNFLPLANGILYSTCDKILYGGVRRYLKEEKQGLVSYFDELDELSLVVQNKKEEVEFKVLVAHNECSPGGKPYRGANTLGGALQQGESKISLNLLEGEQDDTAPLKTLDVNLDEKTPEKQDVYFRADVTPGQGLASVVFMADFLEKPIPLDLAKLKPSDLTKTRIEREMKRHFPPVMPFVEASNELWSGIRESVDRLIKTHKVQDGYLFAKAREYFDGQIRVFDEHTMSPVDRLKRENVFGNNPKNRYPVAGKSQWFESFFAWLTKLYNLRHDSDILHLLAWTYQYDNDALGGIRDELTDKYARRHEPLNEVEVSFCSNNMAAGDNHISEIISEALHRIAYGDGGTQELRLLYNLLQFNPSAVDKCKSEECAQAFLRIMRAYNTYDFYVPGRYGRRWGGPGSTKMAGYFLKCMLFLLHRRRFDDGFLGAPNGWTWSKWKWDVRSEEQEGWFPEGILGESLPCKHESLRRSLIEYVNGRGTIEGIPTN